MTTHWSSGDSQESHTKLCKSLETSARMKGRLGRHLIQRQDLDLVFSVFGEAHKAGHWLWKYQDEDHPNYEASAPALKNGLLNSYRQIDRAVAEMLEVVSPQDNLIVFADHGMQPAYRGDHLVDLILEKMGFLAFDQNRTDPPAAAADSSPSRPRQLLNNGKLAVKRALPKAVVNLLNQRKNSFPEFNWHDTRAFSVPTDRNSHIRINLRGREPMGIVEPGGEYDALLQELDATFRSLINPLTERAAVEEVFHVRSLFPGEHSEDLPDISILWSAEAPIDEVISPKLGSIRRRIRELRSGNHRAEGFLVARGPAFKEGPGEYQGHIQQIAPTLLHLYDVAIPVQYEMTPLHDILR